MKPLTFAPTQIFRADPVLDDRNWAFISGYTSLLRVWCLSAMKSSGTDCLKLTEISGKVMENLKISPTERQIGMTDVA